MSETRTDWSSTIQLPKTDFPMKGDLPKREPEMLAFWESIDIYAKVRQNKKARKPFIFHDGPPYANGHIHIGTALNKILKDMTVKSRGLLNEDAAFIPGWDCHGLPIETALLKEMKMSKRGVTDLPRFRRDAAAFAEKFIDIQRGEFRRLGVFADWMRPYMTMSKAYEAKILKAFRLLLKKGHVYRGLKPVLWCTTCETALAEAEVEYKDKTSDSVIVSLPVVSGELKGAEIAVWTTTPWTLPANRAAAFNPTLEYALVEGEIAGRTRKLIVAKERIAFVFDQPHKVVKTWSGEKIVSLLTAYALPYETKPGETGVCVLADYVSSADGTGIVHTAPGHGEDDFATGQRYNLDILNPVDASGRFTEKAPRWTGLKIFEEGNPGIIADLKDRGLLLASAKIQHSYPHCWRCKNPVIFRTTEQWFLKLSDSLRDKLVQEIGKTTWIPSEGRNRIGSMVANRPDWCLSRQRVWGTPIPVLYSAKTGAQILDDAVLEAIEKKAAVDGTDFWFEKWGNVLTRSDWPFMPDVPSLKDGFKRETDILDVWLDSGVSWMSVLGEDAVADLYLEGSDQHRGWFQSSLVMSTALRDKAPYKAVLTHGFVLDEKGRAMHKSAGNVVAPEQMTGKWGADVLRLWVALSDVHDDVRISDKLMEGPADSYRRVRNTLRYLLGNLHGFNPKDAVAFEKMPAMERFMLHRLAVLQEETLEDYRHFRFRAAARRLVDFCAFDLSAFYLDATKDRLYTYRTEAPERLAAVTVMAQLLRRLCALWAPILSFTAEEAWRSWALRPAESVFLWALPDDTAQWKDAPLAGRWTRALEARAVVSKALEEARARKEIGASLQASIRLAAPQDVAAALAGVDLPEFFIVSKATLVENPGSELGVSVSPAPGHKCPRCWRWQEDIGSSVSHPELCSRCARQL